MVDVVVPTVDASPQDPGAPQPQAPIVPAPPSQESLIQEAVRKALADEVNKMTESARRQIQSAKDKATAEVESAQRRARVSEATLIATRAGLQGTDPETLKTVELSGYRAEAEIRRQLEQEEAARKQQDEFHGQFVASMHETVSELGIDPADKRIDWAEDAPNYLEAQKRVLKSAAKIKKEGDETLKADTQKRIDEAVKAMEAKIRKDLGADSVDTSGTGGVVTSSSDKDFETKFSSGELPLTKENVARFNKITGG